MQLLLLYHAILAFLLIVAVLQGAAGTKAKAKSAAIKPRSKDNKKKGSSPIQQGMFGRLFRETKMFFSSGLEAITLQLTRPTDTVIPMEVIGELVDLLNAEFENPEVVISVLAKLSRKLSEANVYSKLKALLSVQRLSQRVDEPVKYAIAQTVLSLKEVFDKKSGDNFFALSFIEDSNIASESDIEAQVSELTRLYAPYVLSFVEARGRKSRQAPSQSHVELLLALYEASEEIEDLYRESERGPLLKDCFESIRLDRQWMLKQLHRALDDSAKLDSQTEEDVHKLLVKQGIISAPEEKRLNGKECNSESEIEVVETKSSLSKETASKSSSAKTSPVAATTTTTSINVPTMAEQQKIHTEPIVHKQTGGMSSASETEPASIPKSTEAIREKQASVTDMKNTSVKGKKESTEKLGKTDTIDSSSLQQPSQTSKTPTQKESPTISPVLTTINKKPVSSGEESKKSVPGPVTSTEKMKGKSKKKPKDFGKGLNDAMESPVKAKKNQKKTNKPN
jgi:hypothetical protein